MTTHSERGEKLTHLEPFLSIHHFEGPKSKTSDFGHISKYLAPNLVKSIISYLIFDTKSIQSGGQGQAHGFFCPYFWIKFWSILT